MLLLNPVSNTVGKPSALACAIPSGIGFSDPGVTRDSPTTATLSIPVGTMLPVEIEGDPVELTLTIPVGTTAGRNTIAGKPMASALATPVETTCPSNSTAGSPTVSNTIIGQVAPMVCLCDTSGNPTAADDATPVGKIATGPVAIDGRPTAEAFKCPATAITGEITGNPTTAALATPCTAIVGCPGTPTVGSPKASASASPVTTTLSVSDGNPSVPIEPTPVGEIVCRATTGNPIFGSLFKPLGTIDTGPVATVCDPTAATEAIPVGRTPLAILGLPTTAALAIPVAAMRVYTEGSPTSDSNASKAGSGTEIGLTT